MLKNKIDKAFSSKSQSKVIAEFQKIVNNQDGNFPWSKMLSQVEMRFVYDMLSRNENDSNFFPTEKQSNWGMVILTKLNGSRREWETNNKRDDCRQNKNTKKLSNKKEHIARRKAKEYLGGFGYKPPKDIFLARTLWEKGEIKTKPTKKSAIKLLIKWSENNTVKSKKTK